MDLGRRVLQAFALGAVTAERLLRADDAQALSNLRVLYYPPHEGVIDPDMLGCGAHTDYECFTLLAQSDAGGLQVRDLSGQWIEAPRFRGRSW